MSVKEFAEITGRSHSFVAQRMKKGYSAAEAAFLTREQARQISTVRHGKSRTKIHNIWLSMQQRCNDPNKTNYEFYGARGITVCERWLTFENFYEDMGDAAKGMTLERIDNNAGYSPSNCRWATLKEQCRNRRSNVMIEYNGKTQCLRDWTDEFGLDYGTCRSRYSRGMSLDRVFSKKSLWGVNRYTKNKDWVNPHHTLKRVA